MDLEQSQTLLPQLNVNISAKLITSLKILQLSADELSQTISQEMTDNPALEIDERQLCPICGGPLEDGRCQDCYPAQGEAASAADTDYDATAYIETRERQRNRETDEEYDPISLVASDVSLSDYLTGSMYNALPAQDFPIADYLVGSLDVKRILTSCFEELGEHKFDQIASRLHLKMEHVIEAWEFIKTNLTPFPAWSFWRDGQRVTVSRAGYVRPDVAIRPTENGYVVDVLEAERYQLRINEFYPQLIRDSADLSADDRNFVKKCASRAKFFIDCIQQRWNTLRQITECLVECQREFLDHGIRYLKPLTRSEVAFRVNLHESTVSRATANKFILLPNRRVISFDDLFDGSLAIKDAIREIIEHEDPVHPLSDQEIAQRLQEDGVFLARRTVAKYRDAMHVLPSNLRTRMALHHYAGAAG